MNKQEYLLAHLAEECAEVQHIIGKIHRFGLLDTKPGNFISNKDKLVLEIMDIFAGIELLLNNGILSNEDFDSYGDHIDTKKAKVIRYMQISRELGTLHE